MGQTLAFVVEDEDDPPVIYTIGLDDSESVAVTDGDHPAWSPDGETLAFDREMPNGETWVHLVRTG